MKRLHNLKFHPVLEFHPRHMDEKEHLWDRSTKEERYIIWKETMARFGMRTFEPTSVIGTEYVEIAALNQQEIKTLVRWVLLEHYNVTVKEGANILENIATLSGGLYVTDGEKLIVATQCCVSFEDYKEWTDLEEVNRWKRIFIGHPWIYYQYRAEDVLLSEYIDNFCSEEWSVYNAEELHNNGSWKEQIDFENIKDSVIRFQIARSVFEKAIEQLKQDMQLFKGKLSVAIQELGFKQAEKIADYLINGDGESFSHSDRDEVYLKLGPTINT